MAKPSESILTMICAHTARADSTERQPVLCNMEQGAVDRHTTRCCLIKNRLLRALVIAKTIERQRPWFLINEFDRLLESFVGNDRQDRPKDSSFNNEQSAGASMTTVGAIAKRRGDGSDEMKVAPPASASAKAANSRAR